ncbi:NAD(P)/FAD-dependent oxidoreductase [Arthrobacter crusticola]|uniref:NAD(P)/FAD-dependent oxidoreductase n=1 Tax=Arthrobacter crusticola TaxID=2547960 RepID=A0A4R5U2S1_9MICC|nr:FAD-dependent oxidoreductase [Arthrobacter crusticola]TDK27969.1 NAD(P)/FAD-dependent oxidoreductase [Arthrobacter crusticola]
MNTTPSTIAADVIVIGFGKGGKTAASTLGHLGRRVVLIEQSPLMYGGTCPNVGCVPTKALVYHAHNRREEDSPGDWYRRSVTTVHQLTSSFRDINYDVLDAHDSLTILTGKGTFVDPHTVSVDVDGRHVTVTGDTILINTGSEPIIPDIKGIRDSAHVITSTDLIHRTDLPAHLVIIGGGYLGLELGAVYRTFGSEVTILEMTSQILRREDDDVARTAISIFENEGINIVTNANVLEIRDGGDGAVVTYESNGEQFSVEADAVLPATGRAPATKGLGLEAAGVSTTPRGAVVVDEHLRTSQRHIFALGDVNGGPQFTYVSLDDARIVLDQLIGEGKRSTADRHSVPRTLFISPPLATVGLTEREARAAGHRIKVGSQNVGEIFAMPRAYIVEETRGIMKFIIDLDTDLILGAALLSVDSQEMINVVSLAMRSGTTATQLQDSIYTHPSSTEAFNDVIGVIVRSDAQASSDAEAA